MMIGPLRIIIPNHPAWILVMYLHWKWSITWRWALICEKRKTQLTRCFFHQNYQGKGFILGFYLKSFGGLYFQVQPNFRKDPMNAY